jgi:hypothetical protein
MTKYDKNLLVSMTLSYQDLNILYSFKKIVNSFIHLKREYDEKNSTD